MKSLLTFELTYTDVNNAIKTHFSTMNGRLITNFDESSGENVTVFGIKLTEDHLRAACINYAQATAPKGQLSAGSVVECVLSYHKGGVGGGEITASVIFR